MRASTNNVTNAEPAVAAGSHSSPVTCSAIDYSLVWDAFVAGAREARINPTATEKDFNQAADAYCKLLLTTKDKELDAWLDKHSRSPNDEAQGRRA